MQCVNNVSDERQESLIKLLECKRYGAFRYEHLSMEGLIKENREHILLLQQYGVPPEFIRQHMHCDLKAQDALYCEEFSNIYLPHIKENDGMERKDVVSHLERMLEAADYKTKDLQTFMEYVIADSEEREDQWTPRGHRNKMTHFELSSSPRSSQSIEDRDDIPTSDEEHQETSKREIDTDIICIDKDDDNGDEGVQIVRHYFRGDTEVLEVN